MHCGGYYTLFFYYYYPLQYSGEVVIINFLFQSEKLRLREVRLQFGNVRARTHISVLGFHCLFDSTMDPNGIFIHQSILEFGSKAATFGILPFLLCCLILGQTQWCSQHTHSQQDLGRHLGFQTSNTDHTCIRHVLYH